MICTYICNCLIVHINYENNKGFREKTINHQKLNFSHQFFWDEVVETF